MQGIDATFGDVSFDDGRDSRQFLPKIVPSAIALALIAGAGASVLHLRPAAGPENVVARTAVNTAIAPAAKIGANPYGELFDPGFFSSSRPTSLTRDLSIAARLELVPPGPFAAIPQPDAAPPPPPTRVVARIDEGAPLPPPRPAEFGSLAAPDRRPPPQNVGSAPPPVPVDNRSFFEKLFGTAQQPAPVVAPALTGRAPVAAPVPPAASNRVAAANDVAAPDSRVEGVARTFTPILTGRGIRAGSFAASAPPPSFDKYTAVYDIAARTVYLPNGTRLEAHSGLGDRLDDPRYVSERGRGATPPHLYELKPREASFHGVQALRLEPIGDGGLFGRAGLLAHSYMLGPNGDSNGCVSFKDYDAFLRAYQNGEVKRLAVVTRLE